MNEQFTDKNQRDDEAIARKLNQVAEQTHVNSQFAADLEDRLRGAYQPKSGWFSTSFAQVSPVLRWVVLTIILVLVLSLSIKTLIPAPQPAINNTPVTPVITTPTPEINVLPNEKKATPVIPKGGYDFHGATLFLDGQLPDSPAQVRVYLLNPDRPATQEQARALADQFGIQGEMYTIPDYIHNSSGYLISDGKQSLQVHSDKYFSYAADMAKARRPSPLPTNANAETIIRDFLTAHGFSFPCRVYPSEFFGGYIVQPLAPDSLPIQYESFSQPMMRVVLDENGQVLTIDASLMNYDQSPIGEFGIISAQEAFEKLIDESIIAGKKEFTHSPINMPKEWYRTYPDNEPVTLYGYLSLNAALEPGKPALITIDGIALMGKIAGMETLDPSKFMEATGQFAVEDGIRRFNVESWSAVEEAWVSGTLSSQGDRVMIANDDGSGTQYELIDPPADLPIGSRAPDSSLGISGVIVSNTLSWHYIQYFEGNSGGGGGGGGGGVGFYKLNLSGTPVPFPTPTALSPSGTGTRTYVVQENDTLGLIAANYGISVDELKQANNISDDTVMTGQSLVIPEAQYAKYKVKAGDTLGVIAQNAGITVDELLRINGLTDTIIYVGQILSVPAGSVAEQKVENLRGFLSVTLHKKTDGSETREYGLTVNQDQIPVFYQLAGSNLSELDSYNALPIDISGTLQTGNGMETIQIENYKIPFPDLQFQIVQGTQKSEQVGGQTVVMFTTKDGKSYVEFMASTSIPTNAFTGYQGDMIKQELLIIPDETFGGLPVARIYQSSIIQEGAPEMEIQANRISVIDDNEFSGAPTNYTPPNLTIDQVELVYFVSNPYYQVNDPNYDQRSHYIEPVWRFHGHYDDGSEFEILIQALKQEFLLPELSPGVSPG